MRKNPPSRWFAKYKIGFGIGPNTWEGWLITAAGIAVFIIVITVVVPPSS